MSAHLALLPLLAASALALPQAAVAEVRADSLLSVDQNRTEIVEGLVVKWKDHLASGEENDLKKTLMSLRADRLLAVSLAQDQKQFAALLEKDSFLPVKHESPAQAAGQAETAHAKALGDPNTDVVYVPVTPCRLFYTEIASGGAGGALLPGVFRVFDTRGSLTGQGGAAGCSVPTTATAIVLQMGAFSSFGLGWINAGPQGSPIPSGVLMAYNNVAFINATSVTLKINPANGQFSAYSNNNRTELYGDVLGYFAPPSNGNGLRVIQTTGFADAPNIINGSANNSASGQGATVAGGGVAGIDCPDPPTGSTRTCGNRALSNYATVGGGGNNTAGNFASTVAGGVNNTASGDSSTVAGGYINTASGTFSTVAGGIRNIASGARSNVAGGEDNTASGIGSTIAGGGANTANGNYSFAAGFGAKALHERSFVWGGAYTVETNSAGPGTFVVYAPGSINMYAGPAGSGGCILTTPANGWACASDRDLKTNIRSLNVRDVLKRVVSMPVASWSFKGAEAYSHIGPMAQDFAKAFGLGGDDKTISVMDSAGVALAAIQGLNQVVKEKDAKISAQGKEIGALQRANEAMQRQLKAIEKKLGL